MNVRNAPLTMLSRTMLFQRMSAFSRCCLLAATGAVAALAGCANTDLGAASAPAPMPVAQVSAAPIIVPPPTSVGAWQEMGYFLAPWMAGDAQVPVTGPSAPTRVAGLRREDGRWLAIVLVQTAPAINGPCPRPNDVHVSEFDKDVDGCLRMRNDADFDRWLEQQHSVLYHWLDERGWTSRPRGWVAYRVRDTGGRMIEAHALIDPNLLQPTTRNNLDFLAGGQSALHWVREFAVATRASSGGALKVPPFPYAPRAAVATVPGAQAPASAPAKAQRDPSPAPPRPPVQAPRRDRE